MKNKFKNWHRSFFSGLWLEVQIKMHSVELSLAQAKFLTDVMKLRRNQKVLDIPCGNGRISNILAKKGINVTGVDFNGQLLREAERNAKKSRLTSKFHKMNMFDIKWVNEFDAVLCFGGSFGYFSDELNNEFLKRVYSALKKGGRFLIDVVVTDTILQRFQKRGWMKINDIYVLQDRTYNIQTSSIDEEWIFIKKGRKEVKHTSIRLYSYNELVKILKEIGFKKFTAYGSVEKGDFGINSNRLYLAAQK